MYVGRLSFLYQNKNPVDHIIYNETISCFPDLLRSRGFKLNYYFFLNEFITVPNLMEISKYFYFFFKTCSWTPNMTRSLYAGFFILKLTSLKTREGNACCTAVAALHLGWTRIFFSILFVYLFTKLDVSVFLFRLIFLRNSSHVTLGKLLRQCPVPVSIRQHTSDRFEPCHTRQALSPVPSTCVC